MFLKKGVLKNFICNTTPAQTPTQVFSVNFLRTLFFHRIHPVTASGLDKAEKQLKMIQRFQKTENNF